jgi:peptidoglycan/xylan/chitin deacetylase (PgdA/CDA1 family)
VLVSRTSRLFRVVVYHYVRDLPATRFPRINGMLASDFRSQVDALAERHEMATLESAMAFVEGRYRPARDLCLLTFDDGLKDHHAEVLPILAERGIQGLFFITTGCVHERMVAPVHMNHFLMASLELDEYYGEVVRCAADLCPAATTVVDPAVAGRTYPWDSPKAAAAKYLLNFQLPHAVRDGVLSALFAKHLGDERAFAGQLYLTWDESREMQAEGMVIGGHSHRHTALASLGEAGQCVDLTTCAELLHRHLRPQPLWPFSYPYGWNGAFDDASVRIVRELGFACAFVTEPGPNGAGADPFQLRRIDTRVALSDAV